MEIHLQSAFFERDTVIWANIYAQLDKYSHQSPKMTDKPGTRFSKNLKKSQYFRTIYADLKTNLRPSYNTLNIVNITKCINVNIKTSLFSHLAKSSAICDAL